MYRPKPEDMARNANNFCHHAPTGEEQTKRYADVRGTLNTAADHFLTICPASRELSLALTKLEEAMFWANAAIARNEKPD